jgi:hypothetical protein
MGYEGGEQVQIPTFGGGGGGRPVAVGGGGLY